MGTGFALVLRFCGTLGHRLVGGANVDFVRGEVENLGRHGAVLPFCCAGFWSLRFQISIHGSILAGDSIGINGQGVFIRLAKDGKGYGCGGCGVIINLDVGHDQAAGSGEGQEDKAEGEEEGRENAARFHLGDFLSFHAIYDAIKNALAVKSERRELIHDVHGEVRPPCGGWRCGALPLWVWPLVCEWHIRPESKWRLKRPTE